MKSLILLLQLITVFWTHPGSPTLDKFKVYTGTSQDGPWVEVAEVLKTERAAVVADPAPGVVVYYSVSAVDIHGAEIPKTTRNDEGRPVYAPFLAAPGGLTAGP